MSGTLFVVATPIGNLEDVSARTVRVLREVALIAAEDTRRTAHLLARYAIQTPTTSLNAHNESRKSAALVTRLAAGESLALVSDAGTPTVSDPGQYLIRSAIAAGIRVEAIPGPSAVLAILACAGLPTDSFTFLGFPPIRSSERKNWFTQLSEEPRTVVFFESPHRLVATLEQMRAKFGECRIVVGRELTKLHEQVVRGRVGEVIAAFPEPVGEFCIALNLADQQNIVEKPVFTSADVQAAFTEARRSESTSKRKAVQVVARRLGLTPNEVYDTLETLKNSIE